MAIVDALTFVDMKNIRFLFSSREGGEGFPEIAIHTPDTLAFVQTSEFDPDELHTYYGEFEYVSVDGFITSITGRVTSYVFSDAYGNAYYIAGFDLDVSVFLNNSSQKILELIFGGDDTIGGGGTLSGFSGNDILFGNYGSDILIGGSGADHLDGRGGSDTASYENATAAVVASIARPSTNSGDAADDSYRSIENLTGSSFSDRLSGDINANVLNGGSGDDILIGRGGADALMGGAGSDTASYEDSLYAVAASLTFPVFNTAEARGDSYSSIENLTGSRFSDKLAGTRTSNILKGGEGNDTLMGRGGADILIGGVGSDTASYEDTAHAVSASLANPSANTGDARGDTYSSIENLSGSRHSDKLTGNVVANILNGGNGNDILIGRGGADSLTGGSGKDTASYEQSSHPVFASLAQPSLNTGEAKGDVYSSIERLLGSSFSDRLEGDSGANFLNGGAGGNDKLYGGGGADKSFGGVGSDTFIFKSADDSTLAARDWIYDFSQRQDDKISLTGIDASTKVAGNQAFTFIGDEEFSNKAGELRFINQDGDTFLYGDVNGDGKADFSLYFSERVIKFTSGDFFL
jgi:serralysin